MTGTIACFGKLAGVCTIGAALLVAGCAGGGSTGSYNTAIPAGSSCKSIRAELNRLDARGVPARIEAKNAGKKLSAKHNNEVARYNQLLNQYLGAKCHV